MMVPSVSFFGRDGVLPDGGKVSGGGARGGLPDGGARKRRSGDAGLPPGGGDARGQAGGADGVRRVERVFGVLASFYGARFADMWRGVDPGAVKAQWAHALSDVSDEELRTGLAACRGRVWPPTLPEFLAFCRPEPDAERAFAVAQVQAGRRAWGGDVWPDRSLYWAAVAFGWYDLRVMSWQQEAGRWTRVWRECRLKEGALPPVPVCRAVLPQPGRGVTDRETALRRLAALKRRLVSGEKSCGKRALHGVRDEGVAVAGSADVPGAAGLCGMTGACVKE